MKKVDSTTNANGLSMRWVPVVTPDGRSRMEMRWTAPPTLRKQHRAA